MTYYAELDENGLVVAVVPASDLPEPGPQHVEGVLRPAVDGHFVCAPGFGYGDNLPEMFAPVWQPPNAAPDGTWPYNGGEVVWHGGRLWKNVTEGVPNVWEPGVSGWHDAPDTGLPQWVQPTGAHDAYPLNAEVTHNGQNWRNTGSNANVWKPGVFGWVVI